VVRRGSTALASLRQQETVQVLACLVDKHPELAAEAEKLAAEAIAPQPSDQIQASVSKRLGRLEIDDLAELAGMHRGRYVQPWTAAGELIDQIVGPYLEDVRRLAGLGRVAEAHQVAAGVLAGLYACGDVAGHEVLGYVELPDRADEVMRLLVRLEIPLPAEACLEVCPDWQLGR
jgi:hypothetical protein